MIVFFTVCSALEVPPATKLDFKPPPDETPGKAVSMMYLGCVKRQCKDTLISCNKAQGDCAMRLRCAWNNARLGTIPNCYESLAWDSLSNHEVQLFDCVHKEKCMRPGESSDFASSFIEEQVKARNLEAHKSSSKSVEEEALQELRNVLAEHSEDNIRDAVGIAKTITQHHQYMDAVEALLKESQSALEDVEQGKAGTEDEKNKKLFSLLGKLDGAMHVMGEKAEQSRVAHEGVQKVIDSGILDKLDKVEAPFDPSQLRLVERAPGTPEKFLHEVASAAASI